ncbi:MAG: hypothetical protein ACREFV_09660 [Acetobacteraceae bacterium]
MVEPIPTSGDDRAVPEKSSPGSVPPVPREGVGHAGARPVHSVPDVPTRPLHAGFGFTLSEIFGQAASDARPAARDAAIERAEDPGVAEAMEHGEKLFPEVMKASGHAIRDALVSVMPVTFDSFANFGADHLARIAELVRQVSAMTEDLHRIDAAQQIRGIVAEADQANGKTSLLDRMGIHRRFDPAEASAQIDAVRNALSAELYKILKAAVDFERAMIPLNVVVAVSGILSDMTAESGIHALVARKAELFTSSAAEAGMAKKQIENLQKLAQESILQCDELKNVTLPAVGFRRSF